MIIFSARIEIGPQQLISWTYCKCSIFVQAFPAILLEMLPCFFLSQVLLLPGDRLASNSLIVPQGPFYFHLSQLWHRPFFVLFPYAMYLPCSCQSTLSAISQNEILQTWKGPEPVIQWSLTGKETETQRSKATVLRSQRSQRY